MTETDVTDNNEAAEVRALVQRWRAAPVQEFPLAVIERRFTQFRVEVDASVVREYAEDIEEVKEEAPLALVLTEDEVLLLADGFHRFAGYSSCGETFLRAKMIEGTLADALVLGGALNRKNGQRIGDGDRVALARRLVEVAPHLSDTAIAFRAGRCSTATVARIRANLGLERTEREGTDGKLYRVPQAAPPAPAPAPGPRDADEVLPAESQGPKKSDRFGTPPEIVALVRYVMGGIDLDPASEEAFNEVVQADTYYTYDDNGLQCDWRGRVFNNPPYSQPHIPLFVERGLSEHFDKRHAKQLTYLLPAATDTDWFDELFAAGALCCLLKSRLRHLDPDTLEPTDNTGRGASALFYLGSRRGRFIKAAAPFGRIVLERDGTTIALIDKPRRFCAAPECTKPSNTGIWCPDCKNELRSDRAWRIDARLLAEAELAAGREPSASRIAIATGAPSWTDALKLFVEHDLVSDKRAAQKRLREAKSA